MKQFLTLGVFILVSIDPTLCYEGLCYSETVSAPRFRATAFYSTNATLMPKERCLADCAKLDFSISAIENAAFCFCSNDMTGLPTSLGCTTNCPDASVCGGPNNGDMTLYSSGISSGGGKSSISLTISQNVTTVKVGDTVTATVSATESWKIKWGDGTTPTTNDTSHIYDLPGEYDVVAFLTSYPSIGTTAMIRVHDKPSLLPISAPSLLTLGVPQETLIISQRQGYDYQMTWSLQNFTTTELMTSPLPAEVIRVYGTDYDATDILSAAGMAVGRLYLLQNSYLANGGYVTRVKMNAAAAGTLGIYALKPKCSSNAFCAATESCLASCPADSSPYACADTLCSFIGYCTSTVCSTGFAPLVGQYGFTLLTTVPVTAVGNFDYDLPVPVRVPPGSYLAFGCDSSANCNGAPVDINQRNRVASEIEDVYLDSATATLVATGNKSLLVNVVVREHEHINMNVSLLCTTSAAVPLSGVPTPFDATTEAYVWQGKLTFNYTLYSPIMALGSSISKDIICQQNITQPTLPAEVWMPYGTPYPLNVLFSQGSPLFSAVQIDSSIFYSYWDDAGTGWNLSLSLDYSLEGLYTMTGNTSNALGYVLYETLVHVIPKVTDTWTIVVTCPCFDVANGFPFILNFPSAAHPPWNATVATTFELGNLFPVQSVDFATVGNGGVATPLQISRTAVVLQAGTYTATAILSNEVSNTTVSATLTVEPAIRDVTAAIRWNNSGTIMSGLGSSGNLFLANFTTFFYPTCRTGKPDKWRLIINETGEVIETTSFAENFTLVFPQEGDYTLIVSGYNTVQGWVDSPPIGIKVVSKLQGFYLTDDGLITSPGEERSLRGEFAIFTPLSCVLINYGDGTTSETFGYETLCKAAKPTVPYMGVSGNPVIMPHIYQQDGIYDVIAVAFDDKVELLQGLSVTVSSIPCSLPSVEIIGGTRIPDMGQVYWKSMQIIVETKVTFQCNVTVASIERWWDISRVVRVTGDSLEDIPIKNILSSWNYSGLIISHRFLDYGTYKLTYNYKLIISDLLFLLRSDFTFIDVIATPLKPVIIAGSIARMKVGYGQLLDLNAISLSSDPDYPEEKIFNFTWWCQELTPQAGTLPKDNDGNYLIVNEQAIPSHEEVSTRTGDGCFGLYDGALSTPYQRIILNTGSFIKNVATYEIILRISKHNRTATTSLVLEVVANPPPVMKISCAPDLCLPSNDALIVNPSKRLGLSGSCIDYCSSTMKYQWTMSTESGSPVDESSAICNTSATNTITLETSTCEPTFITEKNSSDLALNSIFFEKNKNIDQFRFRLMGTREDSIDGFSEIIIKVNKPPFNGYCQLSETSAIALVTLFPSRCINWMDPEGMGISTYTYYYYLETDVGRIRKTVATTTQPNLDLIMPVGNFDLFVDVSDKLNAITTYPLGGITANMPTKEQLDNFNVSDVIEYLAATGDQTSLGMALIALSSIKDNSSWLSLEPDAVANMTQEEIMERIAEIANLNKDQLRTALNTMNFGTLEQLNIGGSILQSAFSSIFAGAYGPYTIDLESRDLGLQLLQNMTNQIPNIDIPDPNDLVPFLSDTMDAMTSMMKGINEIISQEDMVPPTDKETAANLDYETEITGLDMEIPTNQDTMLKNNILDTTGYRAQFQVEQMFDIIDQVSKEVRNKCVLGEIIRANAPHGASILIAKLGEEVLVDGMTITAGSMNEAAVHFPIFFCPSHYNTPNTKCREPFGLLVTIWPVITHMYPDTSQLLSPKTKVIVADVDIRDERVHVTNETRPIYLNIPRQYDVLPDPLKVNVSQYNDRILPIIYHHFNISNIASAYTIEITPFGNLPINMVLLIDNERMPTPSKYLKIVLIRTLSVNSNGTYTLFVSSLENNNRTGKFFAGVAILKPNMLESGKVLSKDSFEHRFEVDYSFRVYTSGCYFFDNETEKWSGAGLQVTKASSDLVICETKHLTPFGSGFLPTPNVVDFSYLFVNVGFIDNLTIYISLIVLTSVYIVMMIWGHFMDRIDNARRGVTALPDNKLQDKYLYEVTFHTGPDSEASTDSKIMFIASGDYAETKVRFLPPSGNHLYRRFSVNAFVMATPGPLGHINFLRIFHDNSGEPPLDTWQVQMVVFRDLQTNEKYIFDINSWLAFDREEGKVDKIFTVTEENCNTKTFSQKMYIRSNQIANDDHMWMAMFTRPTGSRFGRKERVSVGATFSYLSMLTSAMWYNAAGESDRTGYFDIGPFTLSSEQIIIGACIVCLVFPFAYFLTVIFKRARPRKLKKCRALESAEKQKEHQLFQAGNNEETSHNLSKFEFRKRSTPIPKEKSPVRCIPWWTRIIAWLLILGSIGTSAFFVWSYGIIWGEVKTAKWFSSFIIAFLISLFIVQWLQVIIQSIVSSLCASVDLTSQDVDCDEELPALKYDEEWYHQKYMDPSMRKKVYRVEGVDVEKPEIGALRTRLMKEREMSFVLRGIVIYCFFLVIVYFLVNGRTTNNAFLMKDHLVKTFIKPGHENLDFTKVRSSDDWWRWAKSVVLQETRAQRSYNGEPPYGLRGFMDDGTSRMMGYAILRQIRTPRFKCVPSEPMNQIIPRCSGERSLGNEETKDFCANWGRNSTFTGACTWEEFKYKTSQELGTFPTHGRLGIYGGGGYVFRLSGRQNELLKRMDDIQYNSWIDQNTRAVLLEFSIYNVNVNLFATCMIIAEFVEGGGIHAKWRFEPIRLIKDPSITGFITSICEVLFVLATVFFTLRELWNFKKLHCKYFYSYWNILEVCLLFVSYGAVGLYLYRHMLTKEALAIFNATSGNGYVRLDSAAFVDQIFMILMAAIIFFSTIKLIKLLQFNKRMNVLALTIGHCWEELKIFLIAFAIVFFAFSCLFFFMFTSLLEAFAQITPAIETSFQMMMGKFEFEAMNQANPFSPILFFVFSVMNAMILINIMLTIILKAFSEIKTRLAKADNRLNVIEFVWASFKRFIRLENLQRRHVKVNLNDKKDEFANDVIFNHSETKQLPSKVSRLVQYISEVYFEGRLDLNDPASKRALFSEGGRKSNSLPFKNLVEPDKRKVLISDD